jgi:hypothetical protein
MGAGASEKQVLRSAQDDNQKSKSKYNSRFPSGMTARKAKASASATATATADSLRE